MKTVYPYGSIDTSFNPPQLSRDSTFNYLYIYIRTNYNYQDQHRLCFSEFFFRRLRTR
jgi:hypothetical protein